MIQKDIIDFIQNYMPIAMKQIEQSRADGHLQYAEDIFIKYNDKEKIEKLFQCSIEEIYLGITTSPFFTSVPFFRKWNYTSKSGRFYCLNKGMKASDALDDILNNSVTCIDCILATHVAWYLCIRALLIKFHGEIEGKARFNDLFDDEVIKFVISPYDANGVVGHRKLETWFADNSLLSYFAEHQPNNLNNYMKAADDRNIRIGDILGFYNHLDYPIKKPGEADGGIFVACVGVDQYMGFGLGMKPMSERQIHHFLADAYNRPSLFDTKNWLLTLKLLYLSQHPKDIGNAVAQITSNDVAGYNTDTLRRLNVEKLMTLLQDHQLSKAKIKEYYAHMEQMKRNAIMLSHNHKEIVVDIFALFNETISYLKSHLKTLSINSAEYKKTEKELYLTLKNLAFFNYIEKKDYKASILYYHEALAGFESLQLTDDAKRCRDAIKRSEEAQRQLELSQQQTKSSRSVSPHRDKLQNITHVEWRKYSPGGKACYLFQTHDERKSIGIAKLLNENGINASNALLAKDSKQDQKDRGEFVVRVNEFQIK